MKKVIAPLIAGLYVAASMPPWGWWPLAFLGLAIYASLATRPDNASPFRTAFIFFSAWFLPAMAWMWFLTAPGYIAAVCIFATIHGIAAIVAKRLSYNTSSHRAALVVCHALAEAIRLSFPFGGVPLATLGISQVQGPLAQIAPVAGVIGITTATLWIAFSSRKIRAVLIVAAIAILGSVFDTTKDSGRSLNITTVQGGGPQGTHAINTNPRDAFNAHLAATKTLSVDTTRDMVVWPENVINISGDGLFVDSDEYQQVVAQAQRLQVPFVVGITENAGIDQFTNAQVVVEPNGVVSSRYDKVRRVPFGEYMPLRSVLSAIGAPTDLVPRDARPGDARGWVDVAGTRAAVAISWEIFFGGRVNEGVVDGATFIINPTNGSSYTWTILQSQQIASSRLRALEQGRWVVQVSPTGFSAFVGPDGAVYDRTGITERTISNRQISLRSGRTPYSRLGNNAYFWALLVALAVVVRQRARAFQRTAS